MFNFGALGASSGSDSEGEFENDSNSDREGGVDVDAAADLPSPTRKRSRFPGGDEHDVKDDNIGVCPPPPPLRLLQCMICVLCLQLDALLWPDFVCMHALMRLTALESHQLSRIITLLKLRPKNTTAVLWML